MIRPCHESWGGHGKKMCSHTGAESQTLSLNVYYIWWKEKLWAMYFTTISTFTNMYKTITSLKNNDRVYTYISSNDLCNLIILLNEIYVLVIWILQFSYRMNNKNVWSGIVSYNVYLHYYTIHSIEHREIQQILNYYFLWQLEFKSVNANVCSCSLHLNNIAIIFVFISNTRLLLCYHIIYFDAFYLKDGNLTLSG